jgi:pyridoxamine 5'-phosphate oxidase-like protein
MLTCSCFLISPNDFAKNSAISCLRLNGITFAFELAIGNLNGYRRCVMVILELTNNECIKVLTRLGFGRLGCSQDNQPYIVPIYFAYHERYLYSFATLGQKIEWMRANHWSVSKQMK